MEVINIKNYEDEIWKSVVGYEGIYEISTYGRLVSYYKGNGRGLSDSPRLLKGKIDKDGYMEYCLSKNKYAKNKRAHRLVAEAFIPNTENKSEVNHIDGDKLNNKVSNLEWATTKENCQHKYDIGLGDNSRKVTSIVHGRACELIDIHSGQMYEFTSLSRASEFLGKRNRWLKDIMRKRDYEKDLYNMGYYVNAETVRTYKRLHKGEI